MNTPILTSQNAFSAMMAGKNILCRAVGEMLDFNDLDQFPATIFAQPGYEFCIKIDTMVLAGIEFTKPLTLDEVVAGQDIYLVGNTGSIISGQFVPEYDQLVSCIKNGFVQRDAVNAEKQAKALQSALGVDCKITHKSIDFKGYMIDEKIGRKSTTKTKAKAPVSESNKITAIDADSTNITVVDEPVSANTTGIVITEVADTVAVEESLIVEPDAESSTTLASDKREQFKYVVSLHKQIAAAQSIGDLDALLPQIRDVGGEQAHGLMLVHAKREGELAKPQALTADELKRLTLEAEGSISQSVDEEEIKRQKLLGDLLKNITNAQTPVEVNAQFRYARGWTAEQCKPLHTAISKRLVELDDSKPVEVQTLMGLIQHAPDLTALDVLEIDVGARAPDMQKKLMAEVLKRRRVLEAQEVV